MVQALSVEADSHLASEPFIQMDIVTPTIFVGNLEGFDLSLRSVLPGDIVGGAPSSNGIPSCLSLNAQPPKHNNQPMRSIANLTSP